MSAALDEAGVDGVRDGGGEGTHIRPALDEGQTSNARQEPSRADSFTLNGAALPIDDDPEPSSQRRQRRASHRKSFAKPSPLLKPQRSTFNDDDEADSARQAHPHTHRLDRLVGHIQEWIDAEKAKRVHKGPQHHHHPHTEHIKLDVDLALDKLQQILHRGSTPGDEFSNQTGQDVPKSYFALRPRKRSSISLQKLGRGGSYGSDSEAEVERHPAAVQEVLDNSKTLSYASASTTDLSRKVTGNSAEAWNVFKSEIVRLTHTLKLKGWRRVPAERSHELEVKRLSGALTNAVYVVCPPKELQQRSSYDADGHPVPRAPVPKLLLRIYGPNVEHLIDRESELAILRRLARKNIGPKMLGTFTNGRFEEYLNAQPLCPTDLRDPVISQQIAKRMRELHQGINLLPEERDAGPFIWQNWDKWKDRCEEVIEWLDKQIKDPPKSKSAREKWRSRGFICGVEWKVFRQAVRNYRTWLDDRYGGPESVKESLVFAHNDTQYGNLLRLMPDDTQSPLLQPANQHRRLVVIDFEYANANTPGLEFANHFTEWCYNYHSIMPWACLTEAYPTPEEQTRFFRAYLNHVPHFVSRHPGQTPVLSATSPALNPQQSPHLGPNRNNSVTAFMLDSRGPPSMSASSTSLASSNRAYEEEEKAREESTEKEIKRLLRETRLWRIANSAQWVAWGIVQAKVEGMEEALQDQRAQKQKDKGKAAGPATGAGFVDGATDAVQGANADEHHQLVHDTATEPHHVDGDDEEDDEEEFDYLAYAQDRALFFWGDVLGLGLVKEEELPADLVAKAKRVNY